MRQGNKRKPECEHHCASPKHSSPWTTEHKQQEPFTHRSSLKKFLIAFLTTGFVTFCRYYTALSHSGLIVLTTPYLDVGGSGEVITMARTLYRQESPENVLGVVGADFTLRYFYKYVCLVYLQDIFARGQGLVFYYLKDWTITSSSLFVHAFHM